MRRTLSFLAIAAIALGVAATTASLPRPVADLLENAVTRERQAAARYEAFAKKADEEGFRGAAVLFRAQAAAERTHGRRFAAVLTENGGTLPAETEFTPVVGTTRENLETAGSLERGERDGDYLEAVEACKLHGKMDIAKLFDQTRDSEVEHANLCATAAADLDALKSPRAYYVCGRCGYTTDVKLPFCPVCQHKTPPAAID